MLKCFFASRQWAPWAYGGALLLLLSVWSQVQILVLLNSWYKEFYDLVDDAVNRDISDFWDSIIHFYQLACTYVAIATMSSFLSNHYTFRWRQAMTFDYMPRWQKVEKEIEGASQRIQEDAREFAAIVENLGLELFESILKVISFGPILWVLSENVTIPFFADIPGSLFWVILVLSIGSVLISYLVGIKLPGLEYNNQRVEAAFRKQLVYAEDDKKLADIPTLTELFVGIRFNYFRLFLHYAYFSIWRILFAQSIVLVPYILVAPGLFSGAILLGTVIQVANAFDRTLDGFTFLIRSWTTITKLLSVIKRLREFEGNLGPAEDGPAAPPPVIAVR